MKSLTLLTFYLIIEQECEKRWGLLREKFGRELRKRDLPSGSPADFSSEWPYLESMNFLKEFIKNRRYLK